MPDLLTDSLTVEVKTNSAPSENSYRIYDATGNIVPGSSILAVANYTYTDNYILNGCYKLVFEDGYFTKEAERLTKNLLEPTILKRDQIENIVDMVTAIRNVKTFLHYKLLDALTAEENIEQLQIMRSEVNSK